jgi:ATP-binding cassette subfamily E protein 1
VGPNGTGKSTALSILKGKLKPNLGKYREEPSWEEILRYFRGSEHQAYFQRLLEDKVRALVKPQYVDQVPKAVKGTVEALLTKYDERKMKDHFMQRLDLVTVADRGIEKLSGGELQRFTIASLCVQEATVYMFDEPSSYLDVRQRVTAAQVIRSMVKDDNYLIVVEHDLSIVDYMSDFVCVLYGKPGLYGVVTMPYGVREGINIFLDGFVPTENMRFREESLSFRLAEDVEERHKRTANYTYPRMTKKLGDFQLDVDPGTFTDSEIIVLLGENGCGKTTLIRMLAGHEKPDNGAEVPQLSISYKPQKIAPKFQGTVKDLLMSKILEAFNHPQFITDVIKPLTIEELLDQEVQQLSGGQLQRLGICIALGTPANIYLLDEPSAYLDSDQRIIASRVIKRFILHSKKTAFVVEHDFIMATYLADRVIVYDGTPAIHCSANSPCGLLEGMNKFLRQLNVTFRRDPTNFRPRINKLDSVKDREQKESNNYFYMAEPSPAATTAAAADGSKKKPAAKGKKSQAGDSDDD